MVLSAPGCHDIQCFKLFDITEKRKVWQDIYLQFSYNFCLLIYSIATLFPPKQIHL